jgi:hypothetical protein
MVKVKLFCMQKDEEDILEEWILYHSHLFGIENLYMIDNLSQQPSIDILKKYERQGMHLSVQNDYSKKGDYLYDLIKSTGDTYDFAIPMDIDEFIGVVDLKNMSHEYYSRLVRECLSMDQSYYTTKYPQVLTEAKTQQGIFEHFVKKGFHMKWEVCPPEKYKQSIEADEMDAFLKKNEALILKNYPSTTISCDKAQILEHFEKLYTSQPYGRYSFLYYLTSRSSEMDYERPLHDIRTFDLIDYEKFDGKSNLNKKFFDPKRLTSLDHGNHHGKVEGLSPNQYINTPFVLLHYHNRGVRKLIEKCKNDMRGLGLVKDINDQAELKEKIRHKVIGSHNIQTYLTYLTSGPGALCVFDDEGVQIDALSKQLKN